jgi:hypothetical protein
MTIVDTTILPNNELTDQPNQIETTKLSESRGLGGVRPDFPYPRNGPSCKLLTNDLKGQHEQVSWLHVIRGL